MPINYAPAKVRKGPPKRYFCRMANALCNVGGGTLHVIDGIPVREPALWVKFVNHFFTTDDLNLQEAIEADPSFGRTFFEDKDQKAEVPPPTKDTKYIAGPATSKDVEVKPDRGGDAPKGSRKKKG